jgi:hypothetical protein
MPRGFLPNPDAELLAWSMNFSSTINSDPESFGISPAAAANFAALLADYAAKLPACDPTLRTRYSVAVKNESREKLKIDARLLARIVYGTATVTDGQKLSLGLSVRGKPSPIPPPDDAPAISVVSVNAWTVKLRLHDRASATSGGKPPGVQGASIFSYAAPPTPPGSPIDTAPADLHDWTFQGNFGKTRIELNFPSKLPPGTKVWLAAFWFNPRSQGGPVSSPVATYLQGGAVAMAA